MGVGSSTATSVASVDDTNNNNSITLSEGQMPSHNHDITDPGHSHGVTDDGHWHHEFRSGNVGATQGSSTLTTTNHPSSGTGPSGLYEGYNITSTNSEPNRGRSQTKSTGLSVNSNSAGITSQAKGSGDSIDIRSAYLALCYIIRIT